MAGTDKASKDAWKEINQVISTHNNQMRQQFGKKTWDELTKDLEGYANKWFKNRT